MASLNLSISLKTGDTKDFSYPIGVISHTDKGTSIDLKSLHENILKMQKDSNKFLTVAVENEKATAKEQNNKGTDKDDEDEEDEEGDDVDIEPKAKKKKT